jgi:hypothetical protein
MADLASEAGIERSVRPASLRGISAGSRAPLGALMAGSAHGGDQVMRPGGIRRTATTRYSGVLIGVSAFLRRFDDCQRGPSPSNMQARSRVLPVTNALTASVLERLGEHDQRRLGPDDRPDCEIRAAVQLPLDIYVEAPDNLGGSCTSTRPARSCAWPLPSTKFGLRSAPDVYQVAATSMS